MESNNNAFTMDELITGNMGSLLIIPMIKEYN
jgi:hypothetical protein